MKVEGGVLYDFKIPELKSGGRYYPLSLRLLVFHFMCGFFRVPNGTFSRPIADDVVHWLFDYSYLLAYKSADLLSKCSFLLWRQLSPPSFVLLGCVRTPTTFPGTLETESLVGIRRIFPGCNGNFSVWQCR